MSTFSRSLIVVAALIACSAQAQMSPTAQQLYPSLFKKDSLNTNTSKDGVRSMESNPNGNNNNYTIPGSTGNTGNTGNAGNRRWKQKSQQEMYTGNAQYKKDCGIASAVFCLLLPVRQGQPPRYYPIRRAAPQGFRPEPVPESRPGASWRAPRSQGHAPEVPWRPSKFRCCSLRRAPCPWRA